VLIWPSPLNTEADLDLFSNIAGQKLTEFADILHFYRLRATTITVYLAFTIFGLRP
jgi:hypothetical protein